MPLTLQAATRQTYRIPGSRLAQEYESIQREVDPVVARVLQRGAYCPDVEAEAFEREFASYVGVAHAVGVNSGSMAVMLALMAVGGEPGGRIVSVPNVDISAFAPIAHAGAQAIWVDIDPHTYNLDVEQLEAALTPHTRAILAVHMYGNPLSMDRILEIAGRHGVPVVEDASLAHGATYRGRKVGSIGDIAAFSFCPGKILGGVGQAGAVVTNDANLAERVRVLSKYGFDLQSLEAVVQGRVGARFKYEREGFNARMDELQAAVLRVKLRHLEDWLARRRANARIYCEMLSDLVPEHLQLPAHAAGAEPVYRMFVIRCARRDELQAYLAEAGIWTGLAYVPPLHLQPVGRYLGYGPGSFPQTERVADELLCLPTIPELSSDEIAWVAETIRSFFN